MKSASVFIHVDITRIMSEKIGAMGFEPMTPASRTLCADQTAPRPDIMYWFIIKGYPKSVKPRITVKYGAR